MKSTTETNRIDIRDESGRAQSVTVRRVAAAAIAAAGITGIAAGVTHGFSSNTHAESAVSQHNGATTPNANRSALPSPTSIEVSNSAVKGNKITKGGEADNSALILHAGTHVRLTANIINNDSDSHNDNTAYIVPEGKNLVVDGFIDTAANNGGDDHWVRFSMNPKDGPGTYYADLTAMSGQNAYDIQPAYNHVEQPAFTVAWDDASNTYKTSEGKQFAYAQEIPVSQTDSYLQEIGITK